MSDRPQLAKVVAGSTSRASHRRTLTPRSPFSRLGRAEEGVELEPVEPEGGEDLDEDGQYATFNEQQAAPLLASSASSGFTHTPPKRTVRKREPRNLRTFLGKVPLVLGIAAALFLLFLIFLSIKRPDTLQRYIGVNPSTSSIARISYGEYTRFPLGSEEYESECWKLNSGYTRHGAYWDMPSNGSLDVPHEYDPRVCASTITYMLDGRVGLMADLALIAQVASLARERNRTFLIYDDYWNRGKWTDHFEDVRNTQPGPEPGCRMPNPKGHLPFSEGILIISDPLAKSSWLVREQPGEHWIVSSQTAKFHLGDAFENTYHDPYGHEINRLRWVFAAARTSFSHTIRPNEESKRLIHLMREEFAAKRRFIPYVGVHIRRGDRTVMPWRYNREPIPVQAYVEASARLGAGRYVYLASDAPGLESTFPRAFSLRRSRLRELAGSEAYVQADFERMEEKERVRLTRGMIVDFALLSGMWVEEGEGPVGTVCTVSSNVCKLAAVGLGWERAFGNVGPDGNIDEDGKGWVDIENEDQVSPEWEAFELF